MTDCFPESEYDTLLSLRDFLSILSTPSLFSSINWQFNSGLLSLPCSVAIYSNKKRWVPQTHLFPHLIPFSILETPLRKSSNCPYSNVIIQIFSNQKESKNFHQTYRRRNFVLLVRITDYAPNKNNFMHQKAGKISSDKSKPDRMTCATVTLLFGKTSNKSTVKYNVFTNTPIKAN